MIDKNKDFMRLLDVRSGSGMTFAFNFNHVI